jgi:hypothetical protein
MESRCAVEPIVRRWKKHGGWWLWGGSTNPIEPVASNNMLTRESRCLAGLIEHRLDTYYILLHHIASYCTHFHPPESSIHCFGKSSVVGHDTEVVLSWSQTPRPARFMAFKCPRGARAVGQFIDLWKKGAWLEDSVRSPPKQSIFS